MKLFFCQNDLLLGEPFWQNNSLVSHILFELQPIIIFNPVANFGNQSLILGLQGMYLDAVVLSITSHSLFFRFFQIHSFIIFFQHVCSMNSRFIMFHILKSSARIVDKAPILIITNVQKTGIKVKNILVRNVTKFLRRKTV